MSSLKIALFAFALIALVSAEGATCVGNPYFSKPYNPYPLDIQVPNKTDLDNWNITYDSTTMIYNFSNITNLTLCKGLAKTGSCCHPGLLNKNARDFEKLMNMSNNATIKVFEKRAITLRNFGKVFGKIISNYVNLVSKTHSAAFKIINNVGKILGDLATVNKILDIASKLNATKAVTDIINNQTFDAFLALDTQVQIDLGYQIINFLAPTVGIVDRDIAEVFGGIKTMMEAVIAIPEGLLENIDLFPTVDKGVMSDLWDSMNRIFNETSNRFVNITVRVGQNPTPKARRFLADAPPATNAFNVTIPVPILLDARNIEFVAMAILKVMGNNSANSTEMFNRTLKGNNTIYEQINKTLISNHTEMRDFRAGGDWPNVRSVFITIFQSPFNESVKKIASVAENKKKCMRIVMQYQGYIGCLACDASAVSAGKISLGENGSFTPVLHSNFGDYIRTNCTEYFKDLIFVQNFLAGTKILIALDNNKDQAKKDPKKIDANPGNFSKPNASLLENELDFKGSLNDPKDTWIQKNVIDRWGPTIGFLCDYSPLDCPFLDMIKGTRNPFFNKTQRPETKRMLEETNTTTTSNDIAYSNSTTDEASTTEVGYSTESNYTVDTTQTSDISTNTTQENNTESTNSTNSTNNTNNTNNTNVSNNSNSTNSTLFGLKSLVSIPLIVATILAFLF